MIVKFNDGRILEERIYTPDDIKYVGVSYKFHLEKKYALMAY